MILLMVYRDREMPVFYPVPFKQEWLECDLLKRHSSSWNTTQETMLSTVEKNVVPLTDVHLPSYSHTIIIWS
jgi:hypothetical protein